MEVLNTDPRQLSPLNLAFIGDCVYEMQVRCHLVALANRNGGKDNISVVLAETTVNGV